MSVSNIFPQGPKSSIIKIYKISHNYFSKIKIRETRREKTAKSFSSSSIKKTSTNILMAHKSAPKADTAHKQKNSIPTSLNTGTNRTMSMTSPSVTRRRLFGKQCRLFMQKNGDFYGWKGNWNQDKTVAFLCVKVLSDKKDLEGFGEWIMGSIHYLE